MYFYVRGYAPVPAGVFWRVLVAAVLMVTSRYMGEAGLMLPTLGFLLSLVFWLYILGECFFGAMSQGNLRLGSEAARRGFFWLRLIMTIGWAIFPLTYFIAAFTGPVQMRYLMTTYNLSDFINIIAFALTVLTAAMCEAERGSG
jgi:sensory rhodopsin